MSQTQYHVTCLCKAVKLTVHDPVNELSACHCNTCRQWGGGPLIVADCGSNITFTAQQTVVRYASSEWAQRGFCQRCGTHLFYHYLETDKYFIPAGILDIDESLQLSAEIFVDEQPHYYAFANKTTKLTGAEVIAQYTGE